MSILIRTFLVIGLTTFAASFSIAQNAPTATLDWKAYGFPYEEIAFEFPFRLEIRAEEKLDSPNTPRMYYGSSKGTFLYIFSEPVNDLYVLSKQKDREYLIRTVVGFLRSEGKSITFPPHGERSQILKFRDRFGYWQTFVAFKTNKRHYLAQSVSKEEDDKVADKFISSLRLRDGVSVKREPQITEAATNNSITDDKIQAGNNTASDQTVGSGSGTGSGSGSGSGSGVGTGQTSPSQTVQPSPNQESKPMKLLSRPKPPYTETARFYEITGTLNLLVVFGADGRIGSVTPRTTLPFGLTEQAVDAAKKMTFEPAIMNGKPVSVARTVEYTFTIY